LECPQLASRDPQRACPISIRTVLNDNGKEFTDRLFSPCKRSPTGKHESTCFAVTWASSTDWRCRSTRRPTAWSNASTAGSRRCCKATISVTEKKSKPYRTLCTALQPAASAASLGRQGALAGNERLAQTQAETVQETALSPSGM